MKNFFAVLLELGFTVESLFFLVVLVLFYIKLGHKFELSNKDISRIQKDLSNHITDTNKKIEKNTDKLSKLEAGQAKLETGQAKLETKLDQLIASSK